MVSSDTAETPHPTRGGRSYTTEECIRPHRAKNRGNRQKRHSRGESDGRSSGGGRYSSSESDSDTDESGRMSEFKVPYNVMRVCPVRERTGSGPGGVTSGDSSGARVEVMFHLDQRQTVSDDEFADEKRHVAQDAKPDMLLANPTHGIGGSSSFFSSPGGSAFRPVPSKICVTSSPSSKGVRSPTSPPEGKGLCIRSPTSPKEEKGFRTPPSPKDGKSFRSPPSPKEGKGFRSPSSPKEGKCACVKTSSSPEEGKRIRSPVSPQTVSSPSEISPSSDKGGGGASSKVPKIVVKPHISELPLKNLGRSSSSLPLTASSKKPLIPLLPLSSVTDPERSGRSKQSGSEDSADLTKRRAISAINVRGNVVISPIPRLSLEKSKVADGGSDDVTLSLSRHSGDPAADVRSPVGLNPCSCDCEESGEDDQSLGDRDRNGGEVNGGMRMYRSVLSKIDDQLYLTGEGGAQDLAALREVGIGQVVNVADAVCHEYHPGHFTYLSIDLQDNGAKEDLRPLFLKTIDFIEKHRTVLHCQQGVSRSATMVIAYVMWKNNLTFRQALDYVMKRRPVISPNGGFMGQLLLWEVVLQNSRDARKSAPPRLLRVVPHPGSRHEVLMVGKDVASVSRASLDSRGCFLLHNPATRTVYMWLGNECLPQLAAGGASVCEMLRKYLWVENVLEERQDFESDAFWHTLHDNRGTVGIVDEFNREYARRVPGFIYRFSAFDPIELRCVTLNSLYEQSKRQVWVYYNEQKEISIAVPERFLLRVNGREISDTREIATITSRLFCLVACIPEDTPFTLAPNGKVLLNDWLGTNPAGVLFKKSSVPRSDL